MTSTRNREDKERPGESDPHVTTWLLGHEWAPAGRGVVVKGLGGSQGPSGQGLALPLTCPVTLNKLPVHLESH